MPSSPNTASESPSRLNPTRWWRTPFQGVRVRILFWYILLLGVALFVSGSLLRQLLIVRLDERIDRVLTQEIEEFQQLAGGRDPETGELFGDDIRAIFATFFSRTVPDRDEVYLAIVDGEPLLITRNAPFRIDTLETEVAKWSGVTAPLWDKIDTPAGRSRVLAVPVRIENETRGVFVVAFFIANERDEIDSTIRTAATLSVIVLLVASTIAWLASGRILSPLRELGRTARSISDSDLTARIDVRGNDEIASLARTFNDMLDRLEGSFSLQRRFLDDIGHELHTPITVIRGHLEVAATTEQDPEEQAESLAIVLDELDRMQRMVDDLLTLARSERPDFLVLAPVELADLTDEILSRATVLGQRQWRLDGVASGSIRADRQRLLQAAMNLVSNAVRYTAEDTTIAIGSSLSETEARIWVRDTGPGIAREDQERIFERFTRGNGTTAEGTGLGLAIVRAIADAHGGTVELESTQSAGGSGTTFTIVIPLSPEVEA